MACIHQWEVTGADFPVVRCNRCNNRWLGCTFPELFKHEEAFNILADTIREMDMAPQERRAELLEKAKAIWNQWVRRHPVKVQVG